ncbi:hypothetical protein C6P46_000524 [Rhodotorula mucilaginosa]|uniref:histidine kinase n=1 Tax=Rhodotorula mucilaginosa TaxID=5537 RepID=A0A9P6VUD0_RHOMI|nr:hypothetical protein C6P46_000524 [Rhodotorula mucilaginosa]
MTAPAVLPIPPNGHRSHDSPRDEDAWTQLEQRYQQGTAALNVVKEPVDRPHDVEQRDAKARREEAASPGTAAYARMFYEKKGYLPSLLSPREEERRRVLRRFELHSAQPQGRYPAIDEIAQLAKDVFEVDAVIVNAVLEDRTFFVSSAGWTEDAHAQVEIPVDISFCPHAMGKSAEAGCLQVPNADTEWRFKRNPLVLAERPIKFFASANINLPKVEYAPVAKTERLPIGSLCLVHPSPREPLGDKEEKMLKRMASMVAKEIELSFQVERQRLYDTRLDYVSLLFQQLIVHPSRAMAGRPSMPASLRCVHEGLANKLRTLTESDFAFILDLRGFTGDFAPSPRRTSGSGLGRLDLLDLACHQLEDADQDEGAEDAWKARLCGEEGLRAVQQALLDWHETEEITFSQPVGKEGGDRVATALAAFLPNDTSAVITAPLFDHEGVPALCIVVGSQSPHFQYEPSDQRFVRNVGGVLIAGLLQEKILQADQAKLRFVGHVSHELRTPIFAIGSQLELIRDLAEPEAMTTIGPLLDVAETCLTSLREILDDTLDYTKLSNRGGDVTAALASVDLDALLVDVVRSCWTKSRRLATIHKDYSPDKLDVVFKSTLPAGLRAKVDVGGLKRVLVNLLANSLKFTSNGTITISAFMDETLSDGKRMFRFECSDTGRGMEPGFMRDHLYTAFKQADPFAPGAGLGTSIADNIVRRMGGTLRYESTLNVGTTATVSVPLEAALPPVSVVNRSVIRNLTDELETLFSPRASVRSSPVVQPQNAEHLPPPSPLGVPDGTASPSASSVPPSPSKVEDAKRNESLVIGAVDAVAGKAPRSRTKPVAAQSPHLQHVRALVVDDNSVARKVYCTYLRSKGVDFVDAADGEEAVKLFRQHRPNLVWCDIQMPGMDGIEATRRMRECEVCDQLPPARIIAVSGLDSTLGQHSTVLSSGQVDKWLVKGGSTLRALGTDLVDFAESLPTRAGYGSDSYIPTTLERLSLGH